MDSYMPTFDMQHVENLSVGLVVISRREPEGIGRAVWICMDKLCLLMELFAVDNCLEVSSTGSLELALGALLL